MTAEWFLEEARGGGESAWVNQGVRGCKGSLGWVIPSCHPFCLSSSHSPQLQHSSLLKPLDSAVFEKKLTGNLYNLKHSKRCKEIKS